MKCKPFTAITIHTYAAAAAVVVAAETVKFNYKNRERSSCTSEPSRRTHSLIRICACFVRISITILWQE